MNYRKKSKISTIALLLVLTIAVPLLALPIVNAQPWVPELVLRSGDLVLLGTHEGFDIDLNGPNFYVENITLAVIRPGEVNWTVARAGLASTSSGDCDVYDYNFDVIGNYSFKWIIPWYDLSGNAQGGVMYPNPATPDGSWHSNVEIVRCLTEDMMEIVDLETVAYLSFRPTTLGLTQSLLVNVWVSPSAPSPNILHGYTVEFTKPDGSKYTYGPFPAVQSELTGWFEYVPDQTGVWKIQFKSAAEVLPISLPGYPDTFTRYLACESPILNFTVQTDLVPTRPDVPFPTDWWTTPVHPYNKEWSWYTGDWLQSYYDGARTNYNPYTKGPESSHILWKYLRDAGGIIGGDYGALSYQGASSGNVILDGKTFVPLRNGETVALDLFTGEELWRKEDVPNSRGLIDDPGGYRSTPVLMEVSGGELRKYLAFTGDLYSDYDVPSGISIRVYSPPYVYSTQRVGGQNYLIKWNAGSRSSFDMIYNVSIPFSSITRVNEYEEVGLYITGPTATIGAFNTTDGSVYWSRPATDDDREHVTSGPLAFGRYVGTMYYVDTATRMKPVRCINAFTGVEEWRFSDFEYPWGVHQEYNNHAAYGLYYVETYAGVYAINITTGKLKWRYYNPPEYAYDHPFMETTPFFSFSQGTAIGDGKYYVANGEHSPTNPLERGYKLHCLDALTGDEIWSIDGITTCGSGQGDQSQAAALAYGVLLMNSRYDNYLYAFSRGPSETKVSVSSQTVEKGNSVLITGTVTDLSPAQPGTPCVSKESMADWMEYLHMQQPMPTGVTGVPVDLIAVHEDGSYATIGTATSDLGGFRHEWTPPDEGIYTITAAFNGDESYGSSWAAADVLVTPEPPAPPEPEPEAEPAYLAIDLAIIAAVVVAIILGIVNLWALRKRS